MSDKLPDLIDPLLFADRRSILAGVLKISAFERLSGIVADSNGDVKIEVQFARKGKRATISGTIKAELVLRCQSCLQDVAWPVELNFNLGVVSSLQEAKQLEIDCEPLLFDGEKVSLSEIIEDEILLALPDYPKHDFDCIPRLSSKDADFDKNVQAETHNPFSVLAKLKKTGE